MQNKELTVRLRDNLVITSLDGEGSVLELDSRKVFWVNETASFFLEMLQANHEEIPLSSIKGLLKKQYIINDENKVIQDFSSFIDQLKWYGLISLQQSSNGRKFKNPNVRAARPYLKPMIKEEAEPFVMVSGGARSSKMAAARSAAVSRATASGFRFKG